MLAAVLVVVSVVAADTAVGRAAAERVVAVGSAATVVAAARVLAVVLAGTVGTAVTVGAVVSVAVAELFAGVAAVVGMIADSTDAALAEAALPVVVGAMPTAQVSNPPVLVVAVILTEVTIEAPISSVASK